MADTAAKAPAQFVRFTGIGTREITDEQWDAVEGCKSQKGAVWHAGNAQRVEAKEFSNAALNYLLKVDGEFVLEDLQGNPVE